MEYFTKQEAVSLLGETVFCKKAIVKEFPGIPGSIVFSEEGETACVVLVEYSVSSKGIVISLLIKGDYLELSKDVFCHHFSIEESSYASVG